MVFMSLGLEFREISICFRTPKLGLSVAYIIDKQSCLVTSDLPMCGDLQSRIDVSNNLFLTHRPLVTPFGDNDLGQHWPSFWLVGQATTFSILI